MSARCSRWLGGILLCVALGFLLWQIMPSSIPSGWHLITDEHAGGSVRRQQNWRTSPSGPPQLRGVRSRFETEYSVARLANEHSRAPLPSEWQELTRILFRAEDGDMLEAVKARFSVYAGTKELAVLAEAYDSPENGDTRQRIIEIFSSLQSADFMDAARQILTNESHPIADHLVCACAVSLARNGERGDILAIIKRLNAAGEDPDPEGSLYSDADGLMGALSVVTNPALEGILVEAAAGRMGAITGRTRMAAAAALRNYHTIPVTEILYDLSKKESNALVRKQAESSLKAIQTSE